EPYTHGSARATLWSLRFSYNERVRPNLAGGLVREIFTARIFTIETRSTLLATGEVTTSGTENVQQLTHHKVKVKKAGQRACNEKDAKGKFCGGHLKLWFYVTDAVERECGDVEKAYGKNAEIYHCEN